MKEMITRAEAKTLGLKRYYTGVPCTNGHISERQTSSGACIACKSVANEKHRIDISRKLVTNNINDAIEKYNKYGEALVARLGVEWSGEIPIRKLHSIKALSWQLAVMANKRIEQAENN